MRHFTTGKLLILVPLLLVILGVTFAVISFYPNQKLEKQSTVIINTTFLLTPNETYRQGLGSFHGDENVTLFINQSGNCPINFKLLTYGGTRYSNFSTANMHYSFPAGADYYEAAFQANLTTNAEIHFQASVEEPAVNYPFSYFSIPAKAIFIVGWAALILVILVPIISKHGQPLKKLPSVDKTFKRRNFRWLKLVVILSFVFWVMLLSVNIYPLATFENWYTDSARHPYTSSLFTEVGFSVFNTPLGTLSNDDGSFYKFVTWPEMPNLYPLGSILLYLPFGAMLETGMARTLVFKMEIALLLIASHVCLYLFLKRFWKQELHFGLKALAIYLFYVTLVVYAANGQSDSIAFLFSLFAVFFFLEERYDLFFLFGAISSTIKYQAGIFLVPFILVGMVRLLQSSSPKAIVKNKAILASAGLALIDLFTAYLSAPFLVSARPELIMNVANAFNPHAQLPWALQAFAVLFTMAVALICAVYVLNRTRLVSLFAVFSLLPIFSMPYFQPWYLLFLFVYPLVPQSKLSLQATVSWLVLIMLVLAFGGLAFNPIAIIENIRKIICL